MISKYNNKRINTEDGWFDSKREYARWCELKMLERAGRIKGLQRQVSFELIPKLCGYRPIVYKADLVYEENGKKVVEDSKGFRDRVYRLKVRLMLWRHNVEIVET